MLDAALHATAGGGPEAPSSRSGTGLVTGRPVRLDASSAPRGRASREALPSDAGVPERRRALLGATIAAGDALEYHVYPESSADDEAAGGGFDAACVAVDLVLDDGTRLSETDATDRYGVAVEAVAQRDARMLVVDQWNRRLVDLTPFAGRRVEAVEAVMAPDAHEDDGLEPDRSVIAWIDGAALGRMPEPAAARRPVDRVDTRRGTHATGAFSRGNTIPATALPHGFQFLIPVTDARTIRWPYAYAADDVEPGVTPLTAVALSHQPSPWVGDRGIFQLAATTGDAVMPADRAQLFSHDDEVARPHRWGVTCASGIRIAMAPADHAAVVEMTWPTEDAVLVLDQVDGHGHVEVDATTGEFEGYVDGDGRKQRHIVVGRIDAPIRDARHVDAGHEDDGGVCVRVALDVAPGEPVRIRLATSLIDADHARRSLAAELSDDDTVETVAARAADAWDERLGRVELPGASDDALETLAANLYRLFLYPDRAHERDADGRDVYADPFAADLDPARRTDPLVRRGRLTVNHGFWDVYRTAWTLLGMLDPATTGELLDGVLEHARAGGWISRWSEPGYADAMVGTSADQVLAEAVLRGIPGVDAREAYEAGLRDATVPSDDARTGRKGLAEGIFRGWIPAETGEGMSWSLENALSDSGLARLAEHLAGTADDPADRERYAAEAAYLDARAQGYRLLFDPETGFFRGRTADGAVTEQPGGFDPRNWGGDYTETNAWGMSVSVPHDGAGLAAIMGGRDALAEHLERLVATQETASDADKGTYSRVIHEMREARALRLGMVGLSNQPAHHIPFLFLAAGRPHRTQELVLEAVRRLFTGSDAGQGYPGDEDNGELSAWWVLAALGLYPLALGSGQLVVTTPSFPHARVTLGERTLEIAAPGVDEGRRYIRSATLDGEPLTGVAVPLARIAEGGRLELELAAEPQEWGSRPEQAPASASADGDTRMPAEDLVTADGATGAREDGGSFDAAVLADDTSATSVPLAPGDHAELALRIPAVPSLVTLTASPGLTAWRLEGRAADGSWGVLDERHGERFRWERQTRPFRVAPGDAVDRVRLTVLDAGTAAVQQLEVFGPR